MFGSQKVYATVHAFGVRVKDDRQKDRNHVIEVEYELPLTHSLADDILPAMAVDLFLHNGADWIPKPEVQESVFNLAPDTQLMEVREHPDLDPQVKVAGVTIRNVRAVKGDGGSWMLRFKAGWVLREPKEAITMIQRLRLGVYLTFAVQEPQLDLEADAAAQEAGVDVKTDGKGSVTNITKGKRRGRKVAAGNGGPDAADRPAAV